MTRVLGPAVTLARAVERCKVTLQCNISECLVVTVTSPRRDALGGVVVCGDEVVLLGVLQPRLLVLAVLLLLQPADVAHQQHLVLSLGQSRCQE